MNVTEIVQSSGWKSFMAKLYGIGASVVIIGAMFKIMHWPGASIMIVAGLTTEAIIFFFSAFEPLHEELDWTLVYPELAGMTDPDEMEELRDESLANRGVGLQKFDELFQDANIQPDTIKNLSTGLNSLSQTSENLADITAASLATKEYLNNMRQAASEINKVSSSYAESSGSLNESVGVLTNSYKQTADVVHRSGEEIAKKFSEKSAELSTSYNELTNSVKTDYSNISAGHKEFADQLNVLNKNLAELNGSYEMQINGSKNHIKETENVYKGMENMIKSLQESVTETQKYHSEISKLSQSLSELNNIYGNMLSAMGTVTRK